MRPASDVYCKICWWYFVAAEGTGRTRAGGQWDHRPSHMDWGILVSHPGHISKKIIFYCHTWHSSQDNVCLAQQNINQSITGKKLHINKTDCH